MVPIGHPRRSAGQRTRGIPGRLAGVTGLREDVRAPVSVSCQRLSSSRYSQDMDGRWARGLDVLSVPQECWCCVPLSSDPPSEGRMEDTGTNAPQGQDGSCSANVKIWVTPTHRRCPTQRVISSLTKPPTSLGLLPLPCPELAPATLRSQLVLVVPPCPPRDPDQPLSHPKAH